MSRATQTGNSVRSIGRHLPQVVVTVPSPDDHRLEPTVIRQVRSPPPTTVSVTADSPGARRLRLSAISNTPDSVTPDHSEDSAARIATSTGDHNVVAGRHRPTQVGWPSSTADRVGNRRVELADNVDHDDIRRHHEEAEVQALLRELGISK